MPKEQTLGEHINRRILSGERDKIQTGGNTFVVTRMRGGAQVTLETKEGEDESLTLALERPPFDDPAKRRMPSAEAERAQLNSDQ